MRTTSTAERGFTIIEVMVAAAVLAIGLMGLLSAISNGLKLSSTSRESQLALAAMRSRFDQMKADVFATLYSDYTTNAAKRDIIIFEDKNSNGAYDAGEESLPFVSGQSIHGSVAFLSETEAGAAWGVPGEADLNGDGDANDAADASFGVYAVRIQLQWRGTAGNRSLELIDTIYERN